MGNAAFIGALRGEEGTSEDDLVVAGRWGRERDFACLRSSATGDGASLVPFDAIQAHQNLRMRLPINCDTPSEGLVRSRRSRRRATVNNGEWQEHEKHVSVHHTLPGDEAEFRTAFPEARRIRMQSHRSSRLLQLSTPCLHHQQFSAPRSCADRAIHLQDTGP